MPARPAARRTIRLQLARTRMLPAVAGKTTRAERETSSPSCARRATIHAISQEGWAREWRTDPSCPPPSRGQALALLDPDEHPVTIDIGELERYHLRGSQAGGISQAQDRPVLDVCRRGEQPTDLLRAQNNGQAARLAGRDELLGKIVAFQCDLEEEPQCSGADIGGSHRRPDRRQP